MLLINLGFVKTFGTFIIIRHFHKWEKGNLFQHSKRRYWIFCPSFLSTEPRDLDSCVWPTQEIKKPLQLEAYLCLNYLRMVDINESEAGFSVVRS